MYCFITFVNYNLGIYVKYPKRTFWALTICRN